MVINIGVYENFSTTIGTKKFIIITENTPIIPPNPASDPTDFPLKKSLGNVCILQIGIRIKQRTQ